ncbi:MAG: two-component sensor histidine kinase, partial [Solirubrobacterales bacterium]|nr:two-component sensor histidine kinase [Solirubrobacterales bacterium]
GRERTPAEYRASLQLITRHAQDLLRVLETLLSSARAGESRAAHSSDARTSAEHAAAGLEEFLKAQGKSLDLVCERSPRVDVEGEVVERILSPLLENAARFARERIVLDIRSVDGEVVFDVRDDGPGVDLGERERIFEPGFRGGQVRGDGHTGAGLGLSLVRRLARAAGGEVHAGDPKAGASFAVRLPAA